MTTTTYDSETIDTFTIDWVVPIFQNDRIAAVGFLNEFGHLVNQVEEPDTITQVALRLVALGDEIRENRARDRLAKNEVESRRRRGPHGPTADL